MKVGKVRFGSIGLVKVFSLRHINFHEVRLYIMLSLSWAAVTHCHFSSGNKLPLGGVSLFRPKVSMKKRRQFKVNLDFFLRLGHKKNETPLWAVGGITALTH